jgi:class 3 adenylate cyclase/tetratricopeptide (TPR) repeat protein
MICPHCNATTPDGRFCDSCGGSLAKACPACNAANRATARFCAQCGTSFGAEPAAPPQSAIPLEGEHKQATVLFADLRGSTALIAEMDAEAAIGALDPALAAMRAAVQQFGGVVNRQMGDGIMALFGAPIAAEDHAIRACLAAQAMLAAIGALGDPQLAIRVGICSGNVVVRPTGQDASDYDVVGVTAHIAARLEQTAESNSILLAIHTARLVQGMATLASMGTVPMKGLESGLAVFRLIAAAERPTWDVRSAAHELSGFVGREAELTQIGLALRRARLRRGQAVAIVADAGVGKSRLVHELLRSLPAGAWGVLRVAATPQSTAVPYHLGLELLRAVTGAGPDDSTAEVAARLLPAINAQSGELATQAAHIDATPLLGLLDRPVDEPGWNDLDPAARRRRLVHALRQLVLREAGFRPLILVVDDYHWLDAPSCTVLQDIVDAMGAVRMIVLVTTRPERRPGWREAAWQSAFPGGGDRMEIELQPLPPANADALLCELLSPSDALAPLRARIIARAGGTPFFLEELARSLIESGAIANGEAPTGDIAIPASVQAILAARIDRLPQARRRILQVAAVVGRDVPLPLLAAAASDTPQAVLGEHLAALRAAGFLTEIEMPSGIAHSFRHALTQAVAYDSLLRSHRKELHGRVLAAMEKLYAERLDEFIEPLAQHAIRAEAWPEAARYALAAGERANRRSAWQEAAAFLEDTIAALGHLPRNADTVARGIEARLRLRAVLAPLADIAKMLRSLDEARALAEEAGDRLALAGVNISRGAMLAHWGDLPTAIAVSRMALETMRATGNSIGIVGAAFALGQALWYHGAFAEAANVLTANIAHARGDHRLEGSAITTGTASAIYFCCLASIHAATGDGAAATAAILDARAIADATRRPFDLLVTDLYEGPLHLAANDTASAIAVLERALANARANDIPVHIPFIARVLGRAYSFAGRFEEARLLLSDAAAYAERHGLAGMKLLCGPPRAMALASGERADLDAARATALATLEEATARGLRPTIVHAHCALAHIAQLADDTEAARAALQAAAEGAAALGMRPDEIHALERIESLDPDPARAARLAVLRAGVTVPRRLKRPDPTSAGDRTYTSA